MNLRQVLTGKTTKGITTKDKYIPPGTKVIKGVRCPECGTFYPMASRITRCNTPGCNYVGKKQLTHREMKHQLKRIRREKYNKRMKKKEAVNG
jgi:hypothetical protein